MNKHFFFLFAILVMAVLPTYAQDDPVLFTVNNTPVHVSEFKYIYEKSNGTEADYSRASLEKYLDLYKNFKLKIALAREKKLDTIPALKRELEGYRKKLANSYLIDKEVTDHLAKEAYDRMKSDVRISHIFFSLKHLRSPGDSLAVYKKALDVKKQLDQGASFEDLAKKYSEDKPSKEKGGDIGYFTAIFPSGFYQLEEAAYTTPVGHIAGPVRSVSGYHIIKVTDKRPARGEMEIAQILFSKEDGKDVSVIRKSAEKAYNAITKGNLPFEDAARQFSDDKVTGAKGGYVGYIGINRFEPEFEDAVFALSKDGQISGIVESSIGFHIVKRLHKKQLGAYDKEKRGILTKLRKDPRYQLAIDAFIEKTKKEAEFAEKPGALDKWIASLPDSTFLTHKWRPSEEKDNTVLFTMKGMKATIGDLDEYAYRATRKRLRFGRNTKVSDGAKEIYKDFVNDRVMAYAESTLESKYPEFKALMREYEEGILLFDISRKEVWDKASEDSTGLAAFYPQIQDQFKWEERATVVTYTIPKLYEKQLPKIRKIAKKKTPAKVLAKFNKSKDVVSMARETFEKSKAPKGVKKVWHKGGMTETVFDVNRQPQTASFMVVEKIIPAGPKKLEDARGYAIAKYQDYLEEHWVQSLQNKYKVHVNKEVFESLVK
ncbi:MAG TPA: hypothetical protein ENK85_09530 [Saprospiraceae bacterium]|nr:hypothetical protein [Saprospiraceae bacterium]